MRKIGIAYAAQATAQLDANNLPGAEGPLHQAEAFAADSVEVRTLRSRLRETREAAAIAKEQLKEPSLAERGHLEDLLGEADRALAAGDLMDPGGAYDKFRAVLRIDGSNTRAFAGLARIPARAREMFDKAVTDGKPNGARGYLEAIATTDPGNTGLPALRERLAGVYLDQAEARLGQGQRGEAARALNAARELSPANPRVAVIEQKLQEPRRRST